jgi:hypothetical protein
VKTKLVSDWTVKAANGSKIVIPKGTNIDIPEAADEEHVREVATGAKIPVEEPAPPANEGHETPRHMPTKARPRPAAAKRGRPKSKK